MKVILGSSSPRRKRLLEQEKLDFEIVEPKIKEKDFNSENPIESVRKISEEKMRSIKKSIDQKAIVITADTLGEFKGRILGKPKSEKEAVEWLSKFSNDKVLIHTGYIVSGPNQNKKGVETSEINFKNLSNSEISNYVKKEPVQNLAGGFNVEKGTRGEKLIESIEGSYSNVMGLPLERIIPSIKELSEREHPD